MLQEYNTHVQNKQAIIGIIAAVVILIGAVGVFLYSQNNKKSEPNTTTTTNETDKNISMASDLTSILKSGKTQQCTFSYTDESGNSTSGKTYMTSGQMRTDVTSSVNAKSSTIYVIRDGDDNYIWGSDFPNNTGMRLTMSIDEYASNENSKKYFDPNMKADYECGGWTVDSTMFTPPSSVKFQDLSAMMKDVIQSVSKIPTGAAGSTTSECSICNSLTGDAKTVCMKQFSC